MKKYKGTVENIEKVTFDVIKLEIKSDLEAALCGQFVSILCKNTTLRRPFSICGFENGILTLLIRLKGDGTKYLSSLKKGDEIDFLAPLGKGFSLLNKKSLLVGAGIGIAPMLFLKSELNKKGIENYLISGFKSEDEVIKGSNEVKISGTVLDCLDKLIEEKNIEILYCCGPIPVLKGVYKKAQKYNIISELAFEKVMACGIGVCRGCVIKVKKDNEIKNASICKDGPVFRGEEIVWEQL